MERIVHVHVSDIENKVHFKSTLIDALLKSFDLSFLYVFVCLFI